MIIMIRIFVIIIMSIMFIVIIINRVRLRAPSFGAPGFSDLRRASPQGWYRCLWNKHSSRRRLCLQSPDPLPYFQSWRKDTPRQLTNTSVYFTDRLHSHWPCQWSLTLGRMGGSPTLSTSRMSVYFTDTGRRGRAGRVTRAGLAGRSARSWVGAGVPRSSQRYLDFWAHLSVMLQKGKH